MNAENLDNLREFLAEAEASTLARLFRFLLDFAEIGASKRPVDPAGVERSRLELDDPAFSPSRAAQYLGISGQTLRDSWVEKYKIQFTGDGKNRRYRRSELNRVLAERGERNNGEHLQS